MDSKLDGPGRAAAHEIWASVELHCSAHEVAHVLSRATRATAHDKWCTDATMTTSTRSMRRPTRSRGTARAAAPDLWCTEKYNDSVL